MAEGTEEVYELHENADIIDGIPTFDEIIADPYYKAEFDKKLAEALNIKSHSDVKGGEITDEVRNEGEQNDANETEVDEQQTVQPATTGNPTVEETDDDVQGKEEFTHEMTAEQFDLYNETLRKISKTAKADLPGKYNAFEDPEVKTLVKQKVMKGEQPDVKEIAADVVTRLTRKHEESAQQSSETQTQATTGNADEVLNLKAENALLKAGITTERIEAAKRLFIAEGANFDKVDDFVAKYPEWKAQEGRWVFSKALPLADKTAPIPGSQPILNDFERKVREYRKKAGLE